MIKKEDNNTISIAEFFEKNRHLIGFENPQRALLTSVKEAVDNSLDACEYAGILPFIHVEINPVDDNEMLLKIIDNGPGIPKDEIAHSFGKLLYGTKFHVLAQARGQQGIGISAAVLYSQITTGYATHIKSKRIGDKVAYIMDVRIDLKKNEPEITGRKIAVWNEVEHGLEIDLFLKGKYQRGKQSIYEYLKNCAIVNPHATIELIEPDKKVITFNRASEQLPRKAIPTKPYLHGIEIGDLKELVKLSKNRSLVEFLSQNFSNVSTRLARDIAEKIGLNENEKIDTLTASELKRLAETIRNIPIDSISRDCLVPIGEDLIKKGLKNVLGGMKPSYYVPPVTREPKIWNGNPFIVEVGMVWGGEIPADHPVQILRFANKTPLLFQQGACVTASAVSSVNWKLYGFDQKGGTGIPLGPAIILIHVASTKIPYTSEAKEAIAEIEEIKYEIIEALQQIGRRLRTHMNKEMRKVKIEEKFEIIREVLPTITKKVAEITGKPALDYNRIITKIMNIIWINTSSSKGEKNSKIYNVEVVNYTARLKALSIYADYNNSRVLSSNPEGIIVKERGRISWNIEVESGKKVSINFVIDDFSEDVEFYYSSPDNVEIIGIDPLPGDWNIESIYDDENNGDNIEDGIKKEGDDSE